MYTIEGKHKSLQEKMQSAIKSKKPYDHIQKELAIAEKDLLEKQASFHSLKRALLKESMHIQFDSWIAFSEQVWV